MKNYSLSAAFLASLFSLAAIANPPGNINGKGKIGGIGFKPTFPVGMVAKPPMKPIGFKPIGFKPIGIPPKPIGFKPIGFKPIGIKLPPKPIGIIGIKLPPKPFPIGIKLPPKPIGIIGIKLPPKPFPIGIKLPPKPFPIGIKLPPKFPTPTPIGIFVPPKWPKYPHWPHYPHYPKYPHWPHFPHCPVVVGGVVSEVIVIAEPYPVQMAVLPQGGTAYNLQCALPEGATAQDLRAVNVNLVSTDGRNFQVSGVVSDANNEQQTLDAQAMGGVDSQVSVQMADEDEIYLMRTNDGAGNQYLQGTVRLLGRSDKNGLVCVLNELQSPGAGLVQD